MGSSVSSLLSSPKSCYDLFICLSCVCAKKRQKRALDVLEVELEAVMSCLLVGAKD